MADDIVTDGLKILGKGAKRIARVGIRGTKRALRKWKKVRRKEDV